MEKKAIKIKKENRIKYAYILLFFLPMLTGCLFSGCPKINLSAKDKIFLDPFFTYKTLVFENENGVQHTFTRSHVSFDYSSCNKFELGPNQYEIGWAEYKSTITIKNHWSGSHEGYSFNIDAEDGLDGNAKKYIHFFDFSDHFYNTPADSIRDSLIYCPALNQHINTLYFDHGIIPWPEEDDESIRSIAYSKKYGIIQYITISDTFQLVEVK